MTISEDECLEALREARERLGETPSRGQYEDLDITPSATTIMRLFDSWNAAKERAGLETMTPGGCEGRHGNEVRPKPDDVDLPEDKDWNDLTPRQRWYYEHRTLEIARANRRIDGIKRWLHELKRDEFDCEDCGETDPACIEFHHPNDDKTLGVSRMVRNGYGRDRVREEIEKCVPLCANCHAKRHYEPPPGGES